MQGCFALMDNGTTGFTVYNLSRFRDSAYLPASTFKIVNALIGLQIGKISSDSMVIAWDGITRAIPEWNQDLSMYTAFRVSSVPYFQEVARRIGKDTMQFWLDSMGYGAMTDADTVRIKSAILSPIHHHINMIFFLKTIMKFYYKLIFKTEMNSYFPFY